MLTTLSSATKMVLIKLIFILLLGSLPGEANATHFRYGTITWQSAATLEQPNRIQFTIRQAWRRSYFGNPNVGSTINTGTFSIRNAANTANLVSFNVPLSVTSINVAEDYFEGVYTFVYNFPSLGSFRAFFSGCCRISTLSNNKDLNFLVETLVQVSTPANNSPVSTLPAIVNVPTGQEAAMFAVPVIDPDGDIVVMSITPNGTFGANTLQPPGFSISGNNLILNTQTKSAGSLWNASVRLTDSKGAWIVLDFIFRVTQNSTPPYFLYPPTPANSSNINVQPGQQIHFDLEANDNDPNDVITINGTGLPTGSIFSPVTGRPAKTSFSWTPTSSQMGSYVVTFTATDNAGVTTPTSVLLRVSVDPEFIEPTPGDGSAFCVIPGVPLVTEFKAKDVDPNNAVSLNVESGLLAGMTFNPTLPTTLANPSSAILSWTPSPSNWGVRNLVVRATNIPGFYSTTTVSYVVNNPPQITSLPSNLTVAVGQLFSYTLTATDDDIMYGDHLHVGTTSLPSFLSVVNNHDNTFTISGTPTASDLGDHNVLVEIEDEMNHATAAHCGSDFQTFTLTVIVPTCDPNETLTIDASESSQTVVEGSEAILKARVNPPAAGLTVSFNLEHPDATITQYTAITDQNGVATANAGVLPIGVYKLTASVTDECLETIVTSVAYISVNTAKTGHVTGGGWFMSPITPLSLMQHTGKANFGFVARYKKGTQQVDGNTEFQFKAGNINFKSSMHLATSLVIAGPKAIYKGEGTINGSGSYQFMVSAVDGRLNGSGGNDRFRIKIWEKATGDVVYDNNYGADDNAMASTLLGGGSIVIHKGAKNSIERQGLNGAITSSNFKVTLMNNPAAPGTSFKFLIESGDNEPCELRIYDLTGRLVDAGRKITPGQLVEFGSKLSTGMYMLEITQKENIKRLKLIRH
jgi:hypothetical protein